MDQANLLKDGVELTKAISQGSRRKFMRRTMSAAAAIALAELVGLPEAEAQLGSPNFKNPAEIPFRKDEKKLRAVMEMFSGKFDIPNVGNARLLRQFRGWDPKNPAPPVPTAVGPGPTLRARVGDKVEITTLNRIDDSLFAYTFDTNSKPGLSSFGCDVSGDGKLYPSADKFPNCFHGSSTGNIHFHGFHTSPDGLGDNVLVQILPDPREQHWNELFEKEVFSKPIPASWKGMPPTYQTRQKQLLTAHDAQAAAAAKKNNLPAPEALQPANDDLVKQGQWPEYLMGGFPNYFEIPEQGATNYTMPGQKYKAGQAPGTHWYHAHKHGATALHILNGMSGTFVIESSPTDANGYDTFLRKQMGWGDSYGDHEKILVFQQIDPNQNLERNVRTPRTGSQQVFVNGMLTPTIKMKPGEIQLWRFVNATVGSVGGGTGNGIICPDLFQTAGFTFRQTAQDGVQLSPNNYQNQPYLNGKLPYLPFTAPSTGNAKKGGLVVFAGNRVDVLVQAPLTKTTTPVAFKSNGNTRFFVNVTDDAVSPTQNFPGTWPTMPSFLTDLPKPGPNDQKNPGSPVRFQWEDGDGAGRNAAGQPPHFMINGKQFGETGPVIDQCMPLDGLQDWVLENDTTIFHPFHIHINPFQIIKVEAPDATGAYQTYAPETDHVWQDVIGIPPGVVVNGKTVPGRVTIRQTYPDFMGTFVLHCHILAHEDRGMMELVRIVPAAHYPHMCQGNVPPHH